MGEYLLLLKDSANRVYAAAAAELSVAEARLTTPFEVSGVVSVAGTAYVALQGELDDGGLASLAQLSAARALFEQVGDGLLRPVELPSPFVLDEDLVTIPKYAGKTNELFTRLLLHLTTSQVWRESPSDKVQLNILDPLAGRGTTLLTAWLTGNSACGVESDVKSFEALASYMSTYLRTKRLKHACDVTPVRRDGKTLGKRLDVTLKDALPLTMTVFTGDTRDSAALFGKKARFDAVVTDAPYGVAHGAQSGGGRSRSPEALLSDAIPVWASQLRIGGAMGIAFNTYTLPRDVLTDIMNDAGLAVCEGGAWECLSHRVDAAIVRDIVVATRVR
ncbi:MAG: site-specific DNA-methyltransferase [Propionibacteriaceae bacterium]|jgi:hypothetical protein|nr:site-specific DNA-methyltransferase [Propionibacteriaceae bacterium]